MKYKLVIFDMDGTILNTLEDLTDSTNATLEHFGYPVHSIEDVRHFVGNGIRKLIERAVPSGLSTERIDEVHRYFLDYYAKHCADKTKPYEGFRLDPYVAEKKAAKRQLCPIKQIWQCRNCVKIISMVCLISLSEREKVSDASRHRTQ